MLHVCYTNDIVTACYYYYIITHITAIQVSCTNAFGHQATLTFVVTNIVPSVFGWGVR